MRSDPRYIRARVEDFAGGLNEIKAVLMTKELRIWLKFEWLEGAVSV